MLNHPKSSTTAAQRNWMPTWESLSQYKGGLWGGYRGYHMKLWNYMIHHVCQQWILPIYLASFGAYLEWFFASIVGIIWCLDICNHLGHDSFNPKQIVFSIDFPPAKHLHGVRNHGCTRHPGVLGLVTKKWGLDERWTTCGFFHIGCQECQGMFFLQKKRLL